MKRHDKLAETIPVGTLGILALESSHDLGKQVNDYIVDWRRERASRHTVASTFAGYNRDSFIIESSCPRFGSGECFDTHARIPEHKENCVRIPMVGDIRSLNLGNSAAVILYEALRQNGFADMSLRGKLHELEWKQ